MDINFPEDDWLGDALPDEPSSGDGSPKEERGALVPTNGDGEAEPEGPPEPQTHRDLQRGALQELVELAQQCAELETSIEDKTRQASEDAQGSDIRSHQDLERNFKTWQEQVEGRYHHQQQQIEQKHQQTVAKAKASEENLRKRVRLEYDTLQKEVKHKYDQAVWLSESVLEAAEGKAAEDLKKTGETHTAHIELLTAKEAELTVLLDRYGYRTPPAVTLEKPAETTEDPEAAFGRQMEIVEKQMQTLRGLSAPKLLVGVAPILAALVLLAIAAAIPYFLLHAVNIQWETIAVVGMGILVGIVWFLLSSSAKRQIAEGYGPLRSALDAARVVNDNLVNRAKDKHGMDMAKAARQQKTEAQAAHDRATPILGKAARKRDNELKAAQADLAKKLAENEAWYKSAKAELEQWHSAKMQEVQERHENERSQIGKSVEERIADIRKRHDLERSALEKRWTGGLKKIQEPMSEDGAACAPPWGDPAWTDWKLPTKFPATVRFGNLQVDLNSIIADVAKDAPFTLPLPATFSVPALMAFPKQASMLIHTDRAGRLESIKAMQMIMTRLLTCLPPGRVRFTLLDPVGLGQNFAGFMHLADYDELLVSTRIWTDADQIDQRLTNLTEHMETVIQKYLRNEFATIDEYNAQAGELAEPYRFLVIADFPVNFSDESFRRLSSIASTGARCGVYTLVMRDTRVSISGTTALEDLEAHSINLVREEDKFVWRDPVFQRFPLTLDPAPDDDQLSTVLHKVGKGAREAKRVEVNFDFIAPKREEFWTMKSASDVGVAVGRSGATRLQSFRLGRGVAQHALVAGKTGSGKSTLLHALIANLAMWYSPEEIELYLIDFKKGVEFKTYAMHQLPHARAIAVESDREFGLSVLQRVDAEMTRRSELFRPYKAQNLQAYRESSGQKLPRTLLIIDEFQEFFSEDDKLAQDAALLLDRIVRQGRAFGIHLLLGSQTIGGSSGLSRSTIGQIAVRIALQTSDADSQMILGDGNSAARLLSRPGEAIYNDAGGLVEANSPFQVAWLPDERRDQFLDQVTEKAKQTHIEPPPPIVFEGNEPADYHQNRELRELLDAPKYEDISAPMAWLGDPVAIKPPTSIIFRRQSGNNVLIIGQADEPAMAIMSLGMISLAAQLSPKQAKFYLLDGTPTDAPTYGVLASVAGTLPHEVKNVEYRAVGEAIHEIAEELKRRQESEGGNPPSIFVLIYGLQRYRALRKSEDSFSFGSTDAEAPPDAGKEFADLLREGPANGIHVVAWIDTATALDRTVDRGMMREFDNRILFQMSANDSSAIIDSPAANKLGVNRALAFSEEKGSLEKYRPYAQPNERWLSEVKQKLAAKAQSEAAGAVKQG